MNAPVALCRLDSYDPPAVQASLREILDLLGGLGRFVKGSQYVLIKPNIIAGTPKSQTNAVVIVELAKMVREFGCRVAVADAPAWGSMETNARKSGLLELARENQIPLFELKDPVKIENTTGGIYKHLTVSRHALKPDVIINLPKLKAHQQLKLTVAVKNMFGVVPGKRKAWWHFKAGDSRHFAMMIAETYLMMKPVLTIVDAVAAMDGPGPIRGRLRPVGALIGAGDAFAAELVACKLVNCDPRTLPIVQAGWRLHAAPESIDQVEIVGADPEALAVSDFEFPKLMPVGFSLPRVLKSTLKQAWMKCRRAGEIR